jgi:DNA-directed RNA polymerase specialized sigma24 family protein
MTDASFQPTLDLLREARAGNTEAAGTLLERYASRVLAIVRIRLGRGVRQHVESRDILQEAVLEALGSIDRFEPRGEAAFLHWLARLAERRILRTAEHHSAAKRAGTLGAVEEAAYVPDGAPSAASSLALDEERDTVAECIAARWRTGGRCHPRIH